MKIGIIDNGINKDIIMDNVKINSYNDFTPFEENRREKERTNKGTHSTLVMHTIEKYSNEMQEYYLYNIMNSENNGSIISVMKAMNDILYNDEIKIIVLSLTVSNKNYLDKLQGICSELVKKNKIIVASESNYGKLISYPAGLKDVIGVGKGAFIDGNQYIYNKFNEIQAKDDILSEFIPVRDGRYRLFGGTSKANPKFIRHIIQGISIGADNFSLLEEYLDNNSSYENSNKIDIMWDNDDGKIVDKNIVNKVIKEMKKSDCFFIEDMTKDNFRFNDIIIEVSNLDLVFFNILNEFGIDISLDRIPSYCLQSINSFANFIGRKI